MTSPQKQTKTLQLGNETIGDGHKPVFWPDIDVYFKGNIDEAFRLIDQIAQSGNPFVKGAVLHDPEMCHPEGETAYFVPGKGMVHENYRTIIERHATPLDKLGKIFEYAKKAGLSSVLSVYDSAGIAFAKEMGAVAIKIPSSNIVHQPLIENVAKSGHVMVIDTGRSNIKEIMRAAQWAKDAGGEGLNLIMQHSPAGPPNPYTASHMNMMREIGTQCDSFISLSDHAIGSDMLLVATALGAHVLEKGLSAGQERNDIDLAHALPISELKDTLKRIENVFDALGEKERFIPDDAPRPKDRMGIYAKENIEANTPLTLENVIFQFPTAENGIGVEQWDNVKGKAVKTSVKASEAISRHHLA
jgi:sialic acid synthase SpsE